MEIVGVLAAVLSSAIGGSSIGATRYLADAADPILIGLFRFGIGAALMLPVAALAGSSWSSTRDVPLTVFLGLLFFGAFPVLFNTALTLTTAARGALALSTLPLLTMALAAALRIEPLGKRKAIGVAVAMLGVATSLALDLTAAPPQAFLGDGVMVAAALCMSVYTVLSKSVIQRSDPLTFTVVGMAAGSLALVISALVQGSFQVIHSFGTAQWSALTYLGVAGGALTFHLWSAALRYTTPTKVAISVTANPIAAALVGAWLLDEPLRITLLGGVAVVATGIGLAVSAQPMRKDN
jgi:drug/metabolite transporter (DMT)-like permease